MNAIEQIQKIKQMTKTSGEDIYRVHTLKAWKEALESVGELLEIELNRLLNIKEENAEEFVLVRGAVKENQRISKEISKWGKEIKK